MVNKDSDIIFERKMFFGERLMHVYDKGSILVNTSLFIKGNIEEKNVRIALDKLQKKHPQLRMSIKGKSFVIKKEVAPIHLRIVHRETSMTWKDELEKEFVTPFNYEEGPLMRIVWVRSDDFSEIILISTHTIMDGRSISFITKELARFIDDPEQEIKIYPPLNSLNELLPGITLSWRDKLLARLLIYPCNALLYLLTFGKKEETPKYNYLYWKIEKEEFESLKRITNEHNTTPGALITVLMSKAYMRYYKPQKRKRLIFMSLDMKRYIRTIKKDMLFSFAPMIRLDVDFNKNTDIWELSRVVKDDIVDQALKKSTIKRTFVKYPISKGTLFTEYLHGILKMLIKRNLVSDTGQDFNFINTGSMEFPLKNNSFEIENVMGQSRMPWKNPNIFYMLEYRTLHFHFVTGNNLISQEKVLSVKDEFMNSLYELLNEK